VDETIDGTYEEEKLYRILKFSLVPPGEYRHWIINR
jgi:hypothetical protein